MRKVSGVERKSEGNLSTYRELPVSHVFSTSNLSLKASGIHSPLDRKVYCLLDSRSNPSTCLWVTSKHFLLCSHCTTSQGLNETLHPSPEHFQMTWNNPSPWSPALIIGTLWIKQTPRKNTLHICVPKQIHSLNNLYTGSIKKNWVILLLVKNTEFIFITQKYVVMKRGT